MAKHSCTADLPWRLAARHQPAEPASQTAIPSPSLLPSSSRFLPPLGITASFPFLSALTSGDYHQWNKLCWGTCWAEDIYYQSDQFVCSWRAANPLYKRVSHKDPSQLPCANSQSPHHCWVGASENEKTQNPVTRPRSTPPSWQLQMQC